MVGFQVGFIVVRAEGAAYDLLDLARVQVDTGTETGHIIQIQLVMDDRKDC